MREPLIDRSPCSFQMAAYECMMWKAYLESVYIFALISCEGKALVRAISSAFWEEVPYQQIYISLYIYIYIKICCVISVYMRTIVNISIYTLTVTTYNYLPNEDHCIEQMCNQKVFLKFCLSNRSLQNQQLVSCKLTFGRSDAAAAAKSLQSCPTLSDPIDSTPPGSPVPGILQARTPEWVAISFSDV